jgi:hypothetical protein
MMRTYSKFILSILTLFSIPSLLFCAPIPLGTNVTLANNFDGPTLATFPPDSMIAKGPNEILISPLAGLISADVNGFRDQKVFATNLAFFNQELGIVDTQLRFDPSTNRWFALAISLNQGPTVTRVLTFILAVSKSASLADWGSWTVFSFDQDTVSPAGDAGAGIANTNFDFATFGIDQNALYIGVNLYTAGTSNFLSATAFVIQKSSVLNGGPMVVNAFRNLSGNDMFAPVGVDNFDSNPEFGYIIGGNRFDAAELTLFRIINPGSATPSISPPIEIAVAEIAAPIPAPYKNPYGSIANVNIQDTRLMASLVRNHQLFTVRHIGVDQNGDSGSPDRTGVRWTQLDLTGGGVETDTTEPTVVKEGTLFDNAGSDPNFYYYPAIMTNDAGTMTICGSTSATNVAINAFASNRNVADPSNDTALRNSVQLLTNSNFSLSFSALDNNGREIWGQYSRTCIDPADNRTMWTIQPFVSAFNVIGQQVTQLKV